MRVQRSLNHLRAMTLCWTAKSPRSPVLMASAVASGSVAGPSSAVGTAKFPINPIA